MVRSVVTIVPTRQVRQTLPTVPKVLNVPKGGPREAMELLFFYLPTC